MRNVFADYAVQATGDGIGQRLANQLREHGLVTFDGITTRAAVLDFARHVMNIWPHRDSEPDGVTVLADRGTIAGLPGLAGFGTGSLALHTETATVEHPPQLMMLTCISSAATGGECRLADGATLFRLLREQQPDLLEMLCKPRSVLFGAADGHLGSVFDLTGGQRVCVRLRTDRLAKFAPQLRQRLGDLQHAITDCSITVQLSPGQGYLICNTRWLHGRDAFDGDRLMYRVLGNALPTLDVPAGFVPTETRDPSNTDDRIPS